jgi:hypothetical protein
MTFSKFIAIAFTPCLLMFSMACADYESSAMNEDMDYLGDLTDHNGADTGSIDTLSTSIEATLWSLDATLAIADGQIEPQHSSFTITFWGEGEALCSAAVEPDIDGDGTPDTNMIGQTDFADPTVEMLGQWSLSFTGNDDCTDSVPPNILLGIGNLDDQLIPSVISAGLGPDTLNGLYIQQGASDPTLYVFGAIGTQDQYDGLSGPLTDAPIPDGDYIAQTLYLLPLIAD